MEQKTWQSIQPAEVMEFSKRHIFTDQLLEQFASYTGAKEGVQMADIGCGTGAFTRYLRQKTGDRGCIIGVDADENLLTYAKKKAKTEVNGCGIAFMRADACELPFKDNSLDAVTDHTLLIHMKEPDQMIKEELRVLKKGGVISTATFLADVSFPEYVETGGKYVHLVEIQKKIKTLMKKYIFFSDIPIGSVDKNIYGIAGRYKDAGVLNVQVNGIMSVFSPDDERNDSFRKEWQEMQYKFQAWEMGRFMNEIKRWEGCGLSAADIELALKQLRERFEEVKTHPWRQFLTTTEIIVSGTK